LGSFPPGSRGEKIAKKKRGGREEDRDHAIPCLYFIGITLAHLIKAKKRKEEGGEEKKPTLAIKAIRTFCKTFSRMGKKKLKKRGERKKITNGDAGVDASRSGRRRRGGKRNRRKGAEKKRGKKRAYIGPACSYSPQGREKRKKKYGKRESAPGCA